MISLHVDVRDPPFALPPPQAEFGETIKYEESLQLTSSEASPAFESSLAEASLIYIFPKHKSIKASMTPRLSTPIENIATVDTSQEKSFEPSAEQDGTGWPKTSTPGTKLKVLKNRRSLQSLFVSPFLHNQFSVAHPATSPPKSLSRTRSQPAPRHPESSTVASLKSKPSTSTLVPRSVSPSTFFIDDDPFANICTPPSVTGHHRHPAPTPRSPPSTTTTTDPGPDKPAETTPLPPLPVPSTPPIVTHRPKSSSHALARGASTKPAFTSRPSLPSLHTLAQMNVMIPKKTRRGTVGARLPYEPWNMDLDQLKLTQTRQPKGSDSSSTGHRPKVPSIADFILGLDGDVSESVSTFDIDEEPYGHPLQDFTDADFPPSLSYSPSDPSSYSLSRSSSLASVSSSGLQSVDEMNSSSSSELDLDEPLNDDDLERYNDQDPLQSEPDFDYYWQSSPGGPRSRSRTRSPSTWPDIGRTPHSSIYYTNASLYTPDDRSFQPGTSAETIRSSLYNAMGSARPESSLLPENKTYEQGLVDGSGWDGRHGNGYRGNGDDRDYGRRNSGEREGGSGGGGGGGRRDGDSNDNNYGAGGSGRGGRDQDGDDRKDRRSEVTSSFSTPSDSEDDQEEDTETTTDDYGTDSASPSALSSTARRPVNPIPDSPSGASTGTDDDVPLAQQIPTALKAQKTIRKQVRDERDQRRKEKAAGGSSSAAREPISPRRTTMEQPMAISSSQEAALHPSRSIGRQRTKTGPSNPGRPLAVDDLTKKLLNVQAAGSPPAALSQLRVPRGRDHGDNNDELGKRLLSFQAVGSPAVVTSALRPSSSQGKDQQRNSANDRFMSTQQSRPVADPSSRDKGLRPMRSLRGLTSKAPEGYLTAVETGSGQRLGRSVTSARARRPDDIYLNPKSGSVPLTSSDRIGVDRSRAHRTSEEVARPNISGHTSASAENPSNTSPQRSDSRPPVPPLPPAEVLSNLAQSSSSKIQSTPQRIFIETKQRFNMVEITPSTNAGEVVQMVESQAALEKLGAGSGGWMLWEVAQDFGMERPIREYELLSDVEGSWNKEKLVNIFVIKKTPLASLLSRTAIPPSSPKNRGYVEWESKRGRWNKRWMELREHSLWLSKRDTGKDETLLCSLSNFDVYHVSKLHKSPKPYVFAVKSADNLSLFENASDYVHFFSCGQKEGETWMQAILLARSYVLYQERNILFAPKPGTGGSTSATAKPLSRSGTRKQAPVTQRSLHPIQPLVNVSTSFTATSPSRAVFEPGSLLAKRRDF